MKKEDVNLLKMYSDSKSELSYFSWLEDQLREFIVQADDFEKFLSGIGYHDFECEECNCKAHEIDDELNNILDMKKIDQYTEFNGL